MTEHCPSRRSAAQPCADGTNTPSPAGSRSPGAAARAASAADALTAPGWPIAELAAQGPTHHDIAARLYLSPRTVDYHLHKIFPELGISAGAPPRDALSQDSPQ
ncbi:helix-turn-helix transcriptional regulator [Streptomyces sp. NPDC093149]|uniref:helix-turn-helix domain-containing protein n=1 Tax=Streptomyces sp. NPDC093149 TaxID=3366031 RepID=UPI0038104B49